MSGGHDEFSHPTLITNVIAVIGFVILMLVVLWGLFHLLGLIRVWLANGFTSASRAALSIEVPNEIIDGERFYARWKFAQQTPGSFNILHQCETGVTVWFIDDVEVTCGETIPLTATSSIPLIAELNDGATSTSPLSIIFTPVSTTSAPIKVSTILNVVPARPTAPADEVSIVEEVLPIVTPTETEDAEEESPSPKKPVVTPVRTGRPDLQVTITGMGVVDSYGQFVNRPAQRGETAAVQFNISNTGSGISGNYYFSAGLPTQNQYTYNSEVQSPLAPGEHVANTIKFSSINPSGGMFTVTVDSFDQVTETNENNNIASQSISGYGHQQEQYFTAPYSQPAPYVPQYSTYDPYQTYVPPQQYPQSYDYQTYNYQAPTYGDYYWNDYNYGW